MDLLQYYKEELEIARDPGHPMHILPDPQSARAILDVGCGAGQTLTALNCSPGCLKVGIDISVRAVHLGLVAEGGIHLLAARGESLPFPDATFDFVFSRVALPYMDIPTALQEMRRILIPGGRLWTTLHTARIPARALVQDNWKGKLFAGYVLCNGLFFHALGRTFRLPGRALESWQSIRGMRIALERSGFRDASFKISEKHFIVSAIAG